MSDPFDSLFHRLREQVPPAPFAPAGTVRRRGRQRARRQALAAGVAVLAAVGLGAGGVAAAVGQPAPGPGPVPPAASPTTPTPSVPSPTARGPALAEIPPEWLLTAQDLGAGSWASPELDPWELENGPWIWLQRCAYEISFEEASAGYPSLQDRLDLVVGSWEDGDREPADPGWRLNQTVELFQAGAAEANLADVEQVVGECTDPGTWQVVDRGFAGDGSLLVQEPEPEPGLAGWSYAVVRVGDAVATVMSTDQDLLREVADRAADRLRATG